MLVWPRGCGRSYSAGIPDFQARHPTMTGFFSLFVSSRRSLFLRQELMEQAGFTLVKTFGMERIGQPVEFIIQMVAELMQKGAQEGPERDHAAVLGCAHPEGDDG